MQSYVRITVFDGLGREICTLINEEKQAGVYTTEFDASKLASGVYFYQIKTDKFVQSKKMVVIK
jgi:hypothetical protein